MCGSGETFVLSFVVVDDARQTVFWVEPAFAHQTSLVRLDADAEVHHRIDGRRPGEHLEHSGNRVACFSPGAVDRVIARPSSRQQRVEFLHHVGGQLGQLQHAVAAQRIRRDYAPAARSGEDRYSVTARQRRSRHEGCGVERFVDGVGAHDSQLATQPIEHLDV